MQKFQAFFTLIGLTHVVEQFQLFNHDVRTIAIHFRQCKFSEERPAKVLFGLLNVELPEVMSMYVTSPQRSCKVVFTIATIVLLNKY